MMLRSPTTVVCSSRHSLNTIRTGPLRPSQKVPVERVNGRIECARVPMGERDVSICSRDSRRNTDGAPRAFAHAEEVAGDVKNHSHASRDTENEGWMLHLLGILWMLPSASSTISKPSSARTRIKVVCGVVSSASDTATSLFTNAWTSSGRT